NLEKIEKNVLGLKLIMDAKIESLKLIIKKLKVENTELKLNHDRMKLQLERNVDEQKRKDEDFVKYKNEVLEKMEKLNYHFQKRIAEIEAEKEKNINDIKEM